MDKESIIINKQRYIELLELEIIAKQYAKREDSSWNYGIEELQKKLEEIKQP